MDAPAGFTQEEGHIGFLHLPSAVLTSIFIARRIQPSPSLVDREIECGVPTNYLFPTCWACDLKIKGILFSITTHTAKND